MICFTVYSLHGGDFHECLACHNSKYAEEGVSVGFRGKNYRRAADLTQGSHFGCTPILS